MGPFDGVVFAVVRRIVGEADGYPTLVCKVYGSFDELCAPAAVFGAIVQVDHECRRPIFRLPFGPAFLHTIPNVVARYFGLCKGDV